MLQIKEYVKASSIEEAYQLNQKKSNIIIGGMHWLKMGNRRKCTAIDLSGLGLDEITETEDSFEIGSMVSLRMLEQHEGLNRYTSGAVRDAVKDIVGVQFRNTATVGGSIYGRYGFSDVLTVFMAMDAYVVCHNAGALPLSQFAAAGPDRDVIVKLVVKKTPLRIAYKAQRRSRTDFPVLTCAVSFFHGKWHAAVGARPKRAELVTDVQGILPEGAEVTEEAAETFGKYVSDSLSFGSNMRGSAEYRYQIASVIIRRAVLAAGREN